DGVLVAGPDGIAFHRSANPDAVIKLDVISGVGSVERRDPHRLVAWDRVLQIQPTQGAPRLITATRLQSDMELTAPGAERFRTGLRLSANRLAIFGNEAYLNAGKWKRLGERNSRERQQPGNRGGRDSGGGGVEWADSILRSTATSDNDRRIRNFPNDGDQVTI